MQNPDQRKQHTSRTQQTLRNRARRDKTSTTTFSSQISEDIKAIPLCMRVKNRQKAKGPRVLRNRRTNQRPESTGRRLQQCNPTVAEKNFRCAQPTRVESFREF
eukprot:835244-Amorphochlora_amoeboformis.AAC.3